MAANDPSPLPKGTLSLIIAVIVAVVQGLSMSEVFTQGTLGFKLMHAATLALVFLGYKAQRNDVNTALFTNSPKTDPDPTAVVVVTPAPPPPNPPV